MSSFHFPDNVDTLQDLNRSHLKQHITHQMPKHVKELSPNFILTHWTPDYLYLALPVLSSNPKIVRLALGPPAPNPPSFGFKTLQHPIYFPTSTPHRNPRFYIHSLKSTGLSRSPQYLVLALDPDIPAKSDQKQTGTVPSPVLIIWSISEKNYWRDWNSDKDEYSSELRKGQNTYEMLRGTFVNSEQRFSIPIRSGLDWTKKAFVSCA